MWALNGVLHTKQRVLSRIGPKRGQLHVKDTEGAEQHEDQNPRQKPNRRRLHISTGWLLG